EHDHSWWLYRSDDVRNARRTGVVRGAVMASELRETIPTFGKPGDQAGDSQVSLSNWSALSDTGFAKSGFEAIVIILVAVLVIGGLEVAIRAFDVKTYILPRPSQVGGVLFHHFGIFWPHIK